MGNNPNLFTSALAKATEIEAELKRLNRWSFEPLAPEKLVNMGAFGSNTMAFEQWLQFILLPRIQTIVQEKGEFPENSMVASYAIREFDGDPETGPLHNLLYELDKLINDKDLEPMQVDQVSPQSVTMGSTDIPPVVFTLLDVLPQFEGDDLESQLQTYDTFLSFLSPEVRPVISKLLQEAAQKTCNEVSRLRILESARSVANGGHAAAPYNHEEAMKKYREEHKKSFPGK